MEVGLSSTDMFDWNDEEISNIIWGGAEESSDHIVPFPEGEEEDEHKNLQNHESSAIKLDENKFSSGNLDFRLIRPESSSASRRNAGVFPSGVDSCPDVASLYNTRMDPASLVNDMVHEVLNDSSIINKFLSKETGPQDDVITDFVEYGWDNIGSFDDLDRIFSNQEPIFASVTLDNSEKMWSACKYTADSPSKSFSINANSPFLNFEILSKTSENVGVKSKYGKRGGQPPDLSFEKMEDSVSPALQLKNKVSDVIEGGGGESKLSLVVEAEGHSTSSAIVAETTLNLNEFSDKVFGQQALPKGKKTFKEGTKGKSLPSVQVERPETFSYNHISTLYITPPFFNHTNPAEEVPRTSNYEPGEFKCQPVLPGYEITSSDIDSVGKPLSSYRKPPLMVPQESIAKLRRRRQSQAMLAIQRQLQQLGDPVSDDLSVRISALESPNQIPDGSNDEFDYLSAFPSVDVSSSDVQDESSVLSAAANGYSVEETVLHRLHEVVSKLDSAVQISIRDSLFRLAKSAVQRQQTSDASASLIGGDQHQVAVEDESDANKREVKVTDVETDTNPTDRAVAHLLFHRPKDNSTKHPVTPESSRSTKLNLDRQVHGGVYLKRLKSGKSAETELAFSSQDLGSPCQQNMDCMDTLENGPDYITLEGGAMEVVASQ